MVNMAAFDIYLEFFELWISPPLTFSPEKILSLPILACDQLLLPDDVYKLSGYGKFRSKFQSNSKIKYFSTKHQ
jgi:hypothetical protein